MFKKLAILIILFLPQYVMAQGEDTISYNNTIDFIEITARKPEDVALTKTAIDSAVMSQKQTLSLADLLTENTTIFLKNYGKGSESTASFRGTTPTHTQVYWNGLKVNSPISGAVDFSNIPMFFVSEVNLYHGISSVQNGTGALGGSIEMKSRADWTNRFQTNLVQSIGSFDTYDTYINVKAGNQKFQSATKAFLNISENDFTYINKNIIEDPSGERYHPRQTNKNGNYEKYGFMQEFFMRPTDKDVVSVVVWGVASDRNLPFLSSYEGGDGQNLSNQKDKNLRMTANYKHYGAKADYEVVLGGDFQDMKFNQKSRVTDGYLMQIDSKGDGKTLTAAFNVTLRLFEKHTISLSTNASDVSVDSYDKIKKQGFSKSRFEGSQLVGFYSKWNDRLSSTVLVRAVVSGNTTYIVPVVGMEYAINNNFTARINSGKNYNTPTLSDLYYIPGGNPNLKNEKGMSYEAGIGYQKKTIHNRFSVDATVYYSDIKNWIVWLPSPKQFWTPENIKSVESSGLEFKVTNQYQNRKFKLYTLGTFGLTKSINKGDPKSWGDESVGKQLVYVPRYSANFFAKAEYGNLYAGYQFTYFSKRYTTTSNNKSDIGSLAPYFMNDFFLGWNACRYASIEAKVFNIFNKSYETVINRPMPGRNYSVTIKFNF